VLVTNTLIVAAAPLLVITGPAAAQPAQAAFENAAGWIWSSPPRGIRRLDENRPVTWLAGDVAVTVVKRPDGAISGVLAWADTSGPSDFYDATTYRLVAIAADRSRVEFAQRSSSSNSRMAQSQHLLSAGTASPEWIGIEALTPEGRLVVSDLAVERARSHGIDVLSFPVLDQPYPFALADVEGIRIRSEALRGRVVVIDFWATWCGPCLAKMPKLKDVYEKWHNDGLEVIGISFDRDAETARKAFAERELPWRLVHVPQDEETARLWAEATGVSALPRLLVIDREGVLRANVYPNELEAQIGEYMTP
jgi:thiol-disulfide isomerase/thioredoxin